MDLRKASVALAVTAAVAMTPASALAHVKKGDEWYFRGSTYNSKEARASNRSDPVNLIFYKGGLATNDAVRQMFLGHWRNGEMGNTRRYCKSDQYMVWRHLPGRDQDRNDISVNSSPSFCKKQFHFRGWDDYEHARGTSTDRFQWVVGGIHHENRCATPYACKHHIDRDWDLVRYQAIKAMRDFCSYARWKFHPGAAHDYQDYENTGYIARISMRQNVDGCRGA